MKITTKTLSDFLGKHMSIILTKEPFKNWLLEKTIERDLEKLRIDYVFPQNGFDLICDEDDNIETIFLYFDEVRLFSEDLSDIPITSTRQRIIEYLGIPSKSREKFNDPIFGECGAWDRFSLPGYSIHFEYKLGSDRINRITLMRADVVP